MPDEDREEFLRFCNSIVEDYHAEGPIETQLAQSIAEDFWRLNRGRAWETNTLALGYFNGAADRVNCDHPQIDDAMTQAIVFEKQAKNFALIALYEQRINRNIAKNEQRLRARQAERQAALAQAVEEAKLLEEEAEPQADNWPGLIPTEAESESTALVSLIPTSNETKTDVLVRGFVFSKAKIASIMRHERRLECARQRHLTALKAA